MTTAFTAPSLDELEKVTAHLTSILTLLPYEIRHSIDTSGNAEKYAAKYAPSQASKKTKQPEAPTAQPTKRVKFADEKAIQATSLPTEVKQRLQAKLQELRAKRGGIKKSEKKAASEATTGVKTKSNRPTNAEGKIGALTKKKGEEKPKLSAPKAEPIIKDRMILSNLDTKPSDVMSASKSALNKKKKVTDPKQLLQMAIKRKEKAESKLKDKVEPESTQKDAMKAALAKARGEKVNDDIKLLKSAVKSRDKRKEKSKKEWGKRVRNVQKLKETKNKKRTENIAKRKDKKKK
jgi:hypothetical protein